MTALDFDSFTTIFLPSGKLSVFGRHKALLLCKSPCEGAASVGGRLPCSTEAPAKRNFQRKFALRRFKTKSLLLGSKIVQKRSKPVLPKIKNESAQIFVSTLDLFCTTNLDPRDSKRAAALLSHARQRSPQNATSSWRLDTTLLCAAKKNGVEKKGQLVASTRKTRRLPPRTAITATAPPGCRPAIK